MKRTAVALGAALLLLGTQAAASVDAPPPPTQANIDHERVALGEALKQMRQPNSDEFIVAASLKYILADSAFAALPENERHIAYLAYGAVLFDTKDYAAAQSALKIATVMTDAGAFDWGLRFRASYRVSDYADALVAATKLAQNWPQKLSEFSDRAISNVATESQKSPGGYEAPAAFLDALFAAKWRPQNPFEDADDLWLTLLHIRLNRGDAAGAKAIAETLKDPVILIELHADRQFDALVQQNPQRYDVMAAYAAQLAEMKSNAAKAPDKLEAVNAVAAILSWLDRAQEQFDLVSDAIARAGADPKAFSDYTGQINWSQDQRSGALFRLGRVDEAFAALKAGASFQENGTANVSQAINLADEYNDFDRPKDALAAVASLDFTNASPYGRMALEDARACAYYGLGDKDNLAKAMDYMKAHAIDGMQPYLNAMFFTGDLDGAAAEIIAELNDPLRRDEVLYRLQDYPPLPNASEREKALRANWLAVRARPDVSAAIAKIGHIESYNITSPSY
jgi:hypothetical protein